MLFSISLLVALYWFNRGRWYLQVNVIFSWLCEGSIYLGERIMYLSFAFEIVIYCVKNFTLDKWRKIVNGVLIWSI